MKGKRTRKFIDQHQHYTVKLKEPYNRDDISACISVALSVLQAANPSGEGLEGSVTRLLHFFCDLQ